MAVAQLADYMSEETKKALNPEGPTETKDERVKRNTERAEPVHIRKLLEHMSGADLARRLKCSGPVVTSAAKDGSIYAPYEELARYIWESEYAPKPKADVQVLLKVRPDDLPALQRTLDASGIKYRADVIAYEE